MSRVIDDPNHRVVDHAIAVHGGDHCSIDGESSCIYLYLKEYHKCHFNFFNQGYEDEVEFERDEAGVKKPWRCKELPLHDYSKD